MALLDVFSGNTTLFNQLTQLLFKRMYTIDFLKTNHYSSNAIKRRFRHKRILIKWQFYLSFSAFFYCH